MSRSATRNSPVSGNPEGPVSIKASGRAREYILEAVAASPELLTFGKLEKVIKSRLDIRRYDLKKAVGELITEGELIYSYKHGCSFLEKSFDKPVRISKRIVLAPYRMKFSEKPGDVVIRLQHGISFGSGDHPTTRLALKGIEYVFEDPDFPGNGRALDIGTGSGVLAIACVMLGAASAAGIDTDPCSRKEALENAGINRLGNRIEILDTPVENIKGRFSIVTANLRCPTLMRLYPLMLKLTVKGSMIVLSGIKIPEANGLSLLYTEKHFMMNREESEKGWCAIVLHRNQI